MSGKGKKGEKLVDKKATSEEGSVDPAVATKFSEASEKVSR